MRLFILFVGYFAAIGLHGQSTTPPAPTVRVLQIDQLEEAFRQGGDTLTVYNFWATWCRPCVAELPAFEQMREANKDRPVRVVLVSLDFASELQKTLIPFLQKKDIRSPVWLLDGKPALYIDRISRAWGGSIPATLFVRPSERTYVFKEREFSFEELQRTVDELLR
jgi:thiol-disulfide isomerase/thioredoxin